MSSVKKYYCVRSGRQIGIFETWDECKKQVIGFSNAEFKSFLSYDEAAEWNCRVDGLPNTPAVQDATKSDPLAAVAYVDGSFNIKTHEFSYGAVILHENEELHFNEKFNDKELAKMRNVAGEIKGAEFAMRYCLDNGIKSVEIYYDYEGIAKWANGDWKTNKEGTVAYKSFCESARENLRIRFVKVKGHSGDKYNDLADKLAKEALGL